MFGVRDSLALVGAGCAHLPYMMSDIQENAERGCAADRGWTVPTLMRSLRHFRGRSQCHMRVISSLIACCTAMLA